MDRFGCFFPLYSLRNQHQQHHTTAQNTSNQLAQCNFHHACSCMGSVLFSIMLKETHAVDYVGQNFPEVGWYGKTCLYSLWILLMKSAVRIWIGLDIYFSSLTSQPTSSTTQPHKIPATNLRNAIFTMFVLAWFLSCFPTCWKRHVQYIMLAKVFPRLVGTVKLVCFLCEFWWWKVQLEYGCVWIVFFPLLTSQPTPAAPHNRTKYQQPTCAMQFSPCVFLHGFCSVFHYAERDTCSRLCLEVWYSTVPESKCCLQQLNQPNVIISHSCNTCGHFLQLEYR